jgi:hypothetical protein
MRAQIAAKQLLHRFVFDADSFLSGLRKVVYSGLRQPHFCNRRRNRVCTNRTAADSASADLILSQSVRLGAKHARTAVRVYAAEDSRNLNRRNHEIFTFDCSNYDADERDDDLVQ